MPNRIWSDEKNDWIVVDDATNQAINVEVLDGKGYYRNPKLDEEGNPIEGEFSDDFLSVEECLEKIGDKMNSGDIGAIGAIKDKVDDLDERVTYIEENGGGGGGGANMPTVKLLSENYHAMPTDGEVNIYYNFTSPNIGFGTVYISIDYNTVETTSIPQGRNFYTVKGLEKGEHRLDIYVTDITGLFSNTITVTIVVGGLELTSTFDDSTDISLEDYIRIRYNISTISSTAIEVSIEIDGQLTKTEGIIGQNILEIGQFTSLGVHTVKISAVSGDLVSNELVFNLVVADSNNLYVSTTFPSEYTIQVGKNLQIDYRNSMVNQNRFTTHMMINGNEVDVVTSYPGYNYWNVGTNLEIGIHTLTLYSTTQDGEYRSNYLTWVIEVVAEDYVPFKVVTDGLMCNFDANGKQQTSSTRNIWKDESGNDVKCELFNFNYSTNGWIDNALKFNGKTYAKIDLSPFSDNIQHGMTIDMLFKVKNVGDIDGKVLWCKNPVTPYQGFYINTYQANMRTANSRIVDTQFQDDTWTRITWVINREDLTMICYVNAVITKPIYITDIENFRMDKEIYLGASFDEVDDNLDDNGRPIPHYASCDIKTFRIYNRALTDEEVLQNHIADIKNKEEQLAIREKNYGDSTMPILKFEGNMEGMTGDVYKYLTIDYNDPLDPSKRFRQEQCIVKWQGTSSLEYPVKNYTIELRNGGNVWEYAPKDNWIPEKRYTLKANFMDSSGYNNIGSAKLMYDYMRKSNMFYPQEIKNPKTRAVVDGFPVRLYINGESKGIYMFNIDRYAENNYGFIGEQAVVSYEIGVNSVSGAGAFATDAWSSIRSEFEMRYHYGGDESVVCETITVDGEPATVLKAGYHSELQNLVSWVCNSSIEEFRSELKEHFELNFLIDYYLWVIMLGLVDNLGKNMVLTTFGMNGEGNVIWYPSLYDADSELGLTNDGELRYGSGIDTLTDNFNTSNSRLWVKLNEAFPDEIQNRYIYMRSNGFMTYENIIKYYENIADTVGQTFYNEDARIKYINEANKGFIYMCNGSRLEHTKRWISERITYMDSKFSYGDWLLSSTIRSNVTGDVTLKVKTYSPQWVEISFSDSATGTVKKWCDKDKWYEFKNTITNAVDNNITVRGVTNVMYLQGLEDLNVSSLLVSNAKRLCEIDIHGSKRIQRLELGNNVMLQKLNCKNCTNLGYDDNYKVINLEKCINLKYLDLSGTMVGTVQLNPDGGALEFLDLSETEITYLTCNYQEYLPEIKLDKCSNLSSISITGCNALTRLSLPNTKLAEFTVADCTKLDYLDISYTGYLSKLDLTGCANLTTLKMAGVSNSKFIELDARTLANLTTLDVSKCDFLNNIRFANGFNKLTNIDFQQSGIKTFQFGNNEIPTYLDLSPFSLEKVNFYNCTQVEDIRGINLHATSSITPFYNCINLVSIQGNVSLTGSLGRSFYNCRKLETLPNLDLSRITSASESFNHCDMFTYDMMMSILRKMTNCTNFYYTFENCIGIIHDGIPKEIFDAIPKAQNLTCTFVNTKIAGEMELGIFDSLTELTYLDNPFNGCKSEDGSVIKITGVVPANLFKYNTKLQTVGNLFSGCTQLEVANNINSMFTTTTDLRNIWGLFDGCENAVMLYNGSWFANCPELRNADYAFRNCKNLTGTINNKLLQGKSKLTSAYEMFYNCTSLGGDIPENFFQGCTSLADIHGFFGNCEGLTGSPKTNFWHDAYMVNNASYLFAGCTNLGGDPSNLQEIPRDFFDTKYRLTTIAHIFDGCEFLQFTLQSEWFKDCRQLANIDYAFANCQGLSGTIPNDLFLTRDENGEEMDTVMTGASGLFRNCLNLSGTIPANLFAKFLKVRDLSYFFYSCRNIEGGIPDKLFENCYQLTNIDYMFYQCCKLGKYDDEFVDYGEEIEYDPSLDIQPSPYFCNEYLFMNCTNLISANATFDMYQFGTRMRGDIPPTLFMTCSRLENTSYLFAHCNLLTGGLDSQLFARCARLTNASGTFYGCSGLRGEISGALYSDTKNPKITNFVECFKGCSNLTGTAPTLWSQFSGANRTQCFNGCTKLDNYADIPDGWK